MKKFILCLFLCLNCLCLARLEDAYNIQKTQNDQFVTVYDNYGNSILFFNPSIIKNVQQAIDENILVLSEKKFKIIKHDNHVDYELVKLSNPDEFLCYVLFMDNQLHLIMFNTNNKSELKNFINYIHANTRRLNEITLDVELEIM